MRVIIVMAMQTTLMDQLYVFLNPSIGLGPRVPTRDQWAFQLP